MLNQIISSLIIFGFFITGALILYSAIKKPTIKDKMIGKEINIDGKGGKIHRVYLGIILIGLALYFLLR